MKLYDTTKKEEKSWVKIWIVKKKKEKRWGFAKVKILIVMKEEKKDGVWTK